MMVKERISCHTTQTGEIQAGCRPDPGSHRLRHNARPGEGRVGLLLLPGGLRAPQKASLGQSPSRGNLDVLPSPGMAALRRRIRTSVLQAQLWVGGEQRNIMDGKLV